MEESKKKKVKRIITIVVISVLSFLVVLEGVISISFYSIYKSKLENNEKIISSLERTLNSKIESTSVLDEVISFYKNNYYYEIDDEVLEENLINTCITSVNDPYSTYFSKEDWEEYSNQLSGTSYGIGVLVSYDSVLKEIIVNYVYKNGPAYNAGIQIGDRIIGADDVDFHTLSYAEAVEKIKGDLDSYVTIHLQRNTESISVDVKRGDYELESVFISYETRNDKLIAIVKIDEFYEFTVNEFYSLIQEINARNCDGVIFDVRDNPGGLLSSVVSILDMLVQNEKIVTIRFKDTSKTTEIKATNLLLLRLPTVILVNSNTASAAELFSSTLRDLGIGVLVGEKTYGKGCGQTMFNLSNGGVVKFTTFLYDPPVMPNYDKVGITPDYEVALSDSAKAINLHRLAHADDAQLQYALNLLTE